MDGTAILVKPFFHYNFLTVQTKTLLECVEDVQPVGSFRSAIGEYCSGRQNSLWGSEGRHVRDALHREHAVFCGT